NPDQQRLSGADRQELADGGLRVLMGARPADAIEAHGCLGAVDGQHPSKRFMRRNTGGVAVEGDGFQAGLPAPEIRDRSTCNAVFPSIRLTRRRFAVYRRLICRAGPVAAGRAPVSTN